MPKAPVKTLPLGRPGTEIFGLLLESVKKSLRNPPKCQNRTRTQEIWATTATTPSFGSARGDGKKFPGYYYYGTSENPKKKQKNPTCNVCQGIGRLKPKKREREAKQHQRRGEITQPRRSADDWNGFGPLPYAVRCGRRRSNPIIMRRAIMLRSNSGNKRNNLERKYLSPRIWWIVHRGFHARENNCAILSARGVSYNVSGPTDGRRMTW
jgi:hypothetical protein